MKLGIDRLASDPQLRARLKGKRVALLAHPASVSADLTHSVDSLKRYPEIQLSAAFGPQHGMRGEKQDNMVETEDYLDPVYQIPVYSLYGKVRRPTPEMMASFDVILIDLQDLGCRIYTFITTLLHVLEECARHKKEAWVLDRPNPVGRPIEGSILRPGWESFVGAGPMPMRHGMTMGELAKWYVDHFKLDVELSVVAMEGYRPNQSPGYGWPLGEISWVNPSPNAGSLWMARAYPGTVMIEGTNLSEGRGTTRALEQIGAPDIDFGRVLTKMRAIAPQWLEGVRIRECYFEPTFHKHAKNLCHGIQFHVDDPAYDHLRFQPYRAVTLMFKAIRELYPDYEIWRDFPYEYVHDKLAIDVINGGTFLREWVDDQSSKPSDLEDFFSADEKAWEATRRPFLIYNA